MGARFSAPVQNDSEAHPASYTIGTESFPGVKRPECGADHPPQCSAEVKERVGLYLYPTSGPSWPVIGWTLLYTLSSCRNSHRQFKLSATLLSNQKWNLTSQKFIISWTIFRRYTTTCEMLRQKQPVFWWVFYIRILNENWRRFFSGFFMRSAKFLRDFENALCKSRDLGHTFHLFLSFEPADSCKRIRASVFQLSPPRRSCIRQQHHPSAVVRLGCIHLKYQGAWRSRPGKK